MARNNLTSYIFLNKHVLHFVSTSAKIQQSKLNQMLKDLHPISCKVRNKWFCRSCLPTYLFHGQFNAQVCTKSPIVICQTTAQSVAALHYNYSRPLLRCEFKSRCGCWCERAFRRTSNFTVCLPLPLVVALMTHLWNVVSVVCCESVRKLTSSQTRANDNSYIIDYQPWSSWITGVVSRHAERLYASLCANSIGQLNQLPYGDDEWVDAYQW